MKDVDWENNRIVIPPSRLKSNRGMVVPLNETTMTHLQKLRYASEYLIPLPVRFIKGERRRMDLRSVHPWLHRLQTLARIPKENHFGFHGLRRTLASMLWEHSPQAAQLALGHTASDVTMRHYIQGGQIVCEHRRKSAAPSGAFVPA